MTRWLAGSLGLALGWYAGPAAAQTSNWRPVDRPEPAPAAVLGKPELLPPPETALGSDLRLPPPPAVALDRPESTVRAQSMESPFPPAASGGSAFASDRRDGVSTVAYPPNPDPIPTATPVTRPVALPRSPLAPEERYNHGVLVKETPAAPASRETRDSRFGGWLERFRGPADPHGGPHGFLQSDGCFPWVASPVTNPFLFEDPRSLTEVRPIFLLQTIPNSQPLFRGGNIEWFGVQTRLALTERWSVTINKLGAIAINPGSDSALGSEFGFSELWLGPKYTFLRNEDTRTLGAAGVIFQIPTGPAKVFQDTGRLSVVPYVSAAQNFLRSSFGSFNVMDTFSYAFSIDRGRSDYFSNSFHIDYDVGDFHKIYPLVELNWIHYTNSGKSRPFGTEGGDLINFGSTGVTNTNYLTLAAGVRYKFSEAAQVGTAVEFPLNGKRDLFDFRLTVDFIWRY